jgi:hypothetical protein
VRAIIVGAFVVGASGGKTTDATEPVANDPAIDVPELRAELAKASTPAKKLIAHAKLGAE